MAKSTEFYVVVNDRYFSGFEVGKTKIECNFLTTRSYGLRFLVEDEAKRYYRILREIIGPRDCEGGVNTFKLIAHTHVDEETEIPFTEESEEYLKATKK